MVFAPTDEQIQVCDLAEQGEDLAIEALAGSGKTTTLSMIGRTLSGRRGQYIAFNKKIVTDAGGKFSDNVAARTAHSLAYGHVGSRFRARMNNQTRTTAMSLARSLGLDVDIPFVFGSGEETVELPASEVAWLAKRTVDTFCQTAAPVIKFRHVPTCNAVAGIDHDQELDGIVLPLAEKIWLDLQNTRAGFARFEHNHYLKMWQLEDPVIKADFILFDEAQDANPLMMAIVEAQDAQKIWVGDSQQQIYSWNGAINALGNVKAENRAFLSRSFRFGPEIAEVANRLLRRLGAEQEVVGAGPAGRVGPIDEPDVWLGRTNAAVVRRAFDLMDAGKRVLIQGGTRQITWFAAEAEKLQGGVRSSHPELVGFKTWQDVLNFSEGNDCPDDTKLMINLVESYGARALKRQLSSTVEHNPDVVVSTAHKSKGAEWPAVALLDDFPAGDKQTEEMLRLMYVAVTRAKSALDRDGVDIEGTKDQGSVNV